MENTCINFEKCWSVKHAFCLLIKTRQEEFFCWHCLYTLAHMAVFLNDCDRVDTATTIRNSSLNEVHYFRMELKLDNLLNHYLLNEFSFTMIIINYFNTALFLRVSGWLLLVQFPNLTFIHLYTSLINLNLDRSNRIFAIEYLQLCDVPLKKLNNRTMNFSRLHLIIFNRIMLIEKRRKRF